MNIVQAYIFSITFAHMIHVWIFPRQNFQILVCKKQIDHLYFYLVNSKKLGVTPPLQCIAPLANGVPDDKLSGPKSKLQIK